MSRTISAGLQATLAAEGMRLAVCVKLERIDGTVMGFTTWDNDLVISSVTYAAAKAVTGSAVKNQSRGGVDNLEIIGLLNSDNIQEADVRAGRYDGAEVTLFVCNPDNLGQGVLTLLTGIIGEIVTVDGQYTAELRSLSQRLGQDIGDLTGPLCRVKRLGDSQCGVNLAGFTHTGSVLASPAPTNLDFRIGGLSQATGYFDYGTVKFTSGANNNLEREIKTHTKQGSDAQIGLQEPFPYAVAATDTVQIIAGCDRRLETCRDKFSNVVNFRGEPHIPGLDKIAEVGRPAG